MTSFHFGEHLTIDGYGGDAGRLDSRSMIVSALQKLCRSLGMRPLAEVSIVSAPDNHLKDPGGWSAFLIVAESHISIHTFPGRRFLSADVYTCQNGIDRELIEEFFRSTFLLEEVESHFIQRGLKYPAHNLV